MLDTQSTLYDEVPVTFIDIMFTGWGSRALTIFPGDTLTYPTEADPAMRIVLQNTRFNNGQPEVVIIPLRNVLFYSLRDSVMKFPVKRTHPGVPPTAPPVPPPPPPSEDSGPLGSGLQSGRSTNLWSARATPPSAERPAPASSPDSQSPARTSE